MLFMATAIVLTVRYELLVLAVSVANIRKTDVTVRFTTDLWFGRKSTTTTGTVF